jgi:hypothetical protein
MTFTLDETRLVHVNHFKGKVWLSVNAHGGGLLVALDPEQAKEIGIEIFNAARIEAKKG